MYEHTHTRTHVEERASASGTFLHSDLDSLALLAAIIFQSSVYLILLARSFSFSFAVYAAVFSRYGDFDIVLFCNDCIFFQFQLFLLIFFTVLQLHDFFDNLSAFSIIKATLTFCWIICLKLFKSTLYWFFHSFLHFSFRFYSIPLTRFSIFHFVFVSSSTPLTRNLF